MGEIIFSQTETIIFFTIIILTFFVIFIGFPIYNIYSLISTSKSQDFLESQEFKIIISSLVIQIFAFLLYFLTLFTKFQSGKFIFFILLIDLLMFLTSFVLNIVFLINFLNKDDLDMDTNIFYLLIWYNTLQIFFIFFIIYLIVINMNFRYFNNYLGVKLSKPYNYENQSKILIY